jgi:transglutaminase-like putative cysteine protease
MTQQLTRPPEAWSSASRGSFGSRPGSQPPTGRSTPRGTPAAFRDLRMSGLLLVALGLAVSGLHGILANNTWWFDGVGTSIAVLGAAAVARYFLRRSWLATLIGAAGGLIAVTLFFAPSTAILGLIPTADTFAQFGNLSAAAADSIARQSIPADPSPGIQFLVGWTIAGIALVLDAVVLWWRLPPLAGLPLLLVVVVPSFVQPQLTDPVLFILTALSYLLIIRNRERRIQRGIATIIATAAVLGSLLVPAILPSVTPGATSGSGIGLLAESINPIINLGDDLRRTTPTPALSYTTTADTGQYLRLTTLDRFQGRQWAPDEPTLSRKNTVEAIGAAPGLTKQIASTKVTTSIQVANTTGRWLPVPYPATKVTGQRGNWYWDPDNLVVRSTDSNMQGQKYTVTSLVTAPTTEQLRAAGDSSANPLAAVPRGLDPIVAKTAKEVVGSAKTDFDKALALQDWFRGPQFTYSEHTPAVQGFDGSGLDVIVPFLKTKSGYCVHFATTMAVMARTLGIPSRVAVGFLPGKATHPGNSKETVYTVSSNDLHAWPELYFKGVGWVRFEPTPSRGFEPSFPDAPSATSTSNPANSSAVAEPSAPASAAAKPGANLPGDAANRSATNASSTPTVSSAGWTGLVFLALLLLVCAPWVTRMTIRSRRIASIRAGDDSADHTWQELRETARDLGLDARISATPRELAIHLGGFLTRNAQPQAAEALDALRRIVEGESYAQVRSTDAGIRMAAELRIVLRGLRRASDTGPRLRAALFPATLADRILGRGVVRA